MLESKKCRHTSFIATHAHKRWRPCCQITPQTGATQSLKWQWHIIQPSELRRWKQPLTPSPWKPRMTGKMVALTAKGCPVISTPLSKAERVNDTEQNTCTWCNICSFSDYKKIFPSIYAEPASGGDVSSNHTTDQKLTLSLIHSDPNFYDILQVHDAAFGSSYSCSFRQLSTAV